MTAPSATNGGGGRPRLLDLFCGAGGASMGYHQAGFDVVGVDLHPQPRYPFEFHQADAMEFPLDGFDAVHASPPCQKFCALKSMPNARKDHADLLTPTRPRLKAAGVPYAIENVPGAPLARGSIMLCGTMFGLGTMDGRAELRRHRWFECSHVILAPECQHFRMTIGNYGDGNGRDYRRDPIVIGVYGGHGRDRRRIKPRTVGVWGNAGGRSVRDGVQQFSTQERREAMGIDWMTGNELSEAIPPAYSKFIGEQLIRLCRAKAGAA